MLTNIWKAHDSSPWQNKFYQWNSKSLIEAHDSNSWQFIQSPILIGNIKAQFSLATWKLNSHWQHQNPIFINSTLSKKKRVQDYQSLAKKKKISCYQSKKGSLQVFMKKPKKNVFTNKSPWGIKTHGNMRTQLNPCEQETPAEGKGE